MSLKLAAPLLWRLDPCRAVFAPLAPAAQVRRQAPLAPPKAPTGLKLVTWNLKFGGARLDFFFDGHGDRRRMTRAEVRQNLLGIAAKLAALNPDVVLLQEVDVWAWRSGLLDQLAFLLEHTRLSFGAYASQWRARFIPAEGLGPMDSGNAVLSRFPVLSARRHGLALMAEQDPLTQYFYLKRCLLEVRLGTPGRPLSVLATHLSAYAHDDTQKRQLAQVTQAMARLQAAGECAILGGDFNLVPPTATVLHGFPDVVTDDPRFAGEDHRGRSEWLRDLYDRYSAAIPLSEHARHEAAHFTHSLSARHPFNRTLDHLFCTHRLVDGATHQDAHPLSDHAPVSATLPWPPEAVPC